MSAITGIFYRNGHSVSLEEIKKINDQLNHRGIDGKRVWAEGSIAMGHQMLHTTIESLQEKLPFHDEISGISITADARIDNRNELSQLLGLENRIHIPDSLFILKAYQKWGEGCPERLFGDFSFAIWDDKNNKLFCARDHMGVKPFYYYLSNDVFVWATEIKAILVNHKVEPKINETNIAYFLSHLYKDREITFYEDILRLPAAHKLMISYEDFKLEKYWEIDPNKKIIFESDLQYYNMFLKIFKKAVNSRLRSAFPLGAMLSGGLDSSSIVCTARDILLKSEGYPLKTFSIIFEETPESDESKYINFVLKKGFLDPYYINADDYSPIFEYNPVIWQEDSPVRAFNLYYDYLLADLARKKGVRILLDGVGGDSTISHGEGLSIDFLRNNQWKKFFEEIKYTSERLNTNMLHVFLNELLISYPNLRTLQYVPKLRKKKKIISQKFSRDIHLKHLINSFSNEQIKIHEKARKCHYRDINSGLFQYALEENDRIHAALNIENRYPFFDVQLMEFCYSIPSEQKRKYGWNRFYMRQAMDNILPNEIQWRKTKKTGLVSNIRNFINFDKDFIEDVIFRDEPDIHDYVDMVVLKKLYQNFQNNPNPQDFFELWKAVSLGLWIRKTE